MKVTIVETKFVLGPLELELFSSEGRNEEGVDLCTASEVLEMEFSDVRTVLLIVGIDTTDHNVVISGVYVVIRPALVE